MEKLELYHKEAMGKLKSALLAIRNVKDVGKMEEESSGAVVVPTDNPHC